MDSKKMDEMIEKEIEAIARIRWTKEEEEILVYSWKKGLKSNSIHKLKFIPDKTRKQIENKATQLGVRDA